MNRIPSVEPPTTRRKVRLAQQKWQDAVTWREILVDDVPRSQIQYCIYGWMDKEIKR